jgi:hypothetical protein
MSALVLVESVVVVGAFAAMMGTKMRLLLIMMDDKPYRPFSLLESSMMMHHYC